MDFVVEKARAKTNLVLDIIAKRSDGYHDLGTLFQTLDLFEEVKLTRQESGRIQVVNDPNVAHDIKDNLLYKAALFMQERLGFDLHVKIECDKKLPMGAGLGGGSADAAAVIRGLIKLFRLQFDKEQLLKDSGKLGADVPFMVRGASQWATGIGDELSLAEIPKAWLDLRVLVITPQCFVGTKEAYAKVKPRGDEAFNQVKDRYSVGHQSYELIYNEFEKSVFVQFEEIVQMKSLLEKSGANKVFLSGSGASLIALYNDRVANNALQKVFSQSRFHAWTRFDIEAENF